MEVMKGTPPPLPPKTKKLATMHQSPDLEAQNRRIISIAPANSFEVGSLKIVNNQRHNEDNFSPPQKKAESQSEKKTDGSDISKNEAFGPRIITWKESASEDLYENVSGGINYLENRLNNIAGKRQTPKIEVRQEDNKTVVKISMKDAVTPEEEMNGENLYANGCAANVYANCDDVYENVETFENLSNDYYENVEQLYGNVRTGKKELVSEANYDDESKCDQVYENGDFHVSKKNVVSVIGQNSVSEPISFTKHEGDDESYENVKNDYHTYANLYRNGETAEKMESRKPVKKSSVVEVFLHKQSAMKVDKEPEYADDASSGDPFDSGTCSDVDSLLPAFVQSKKGNVIVTIKSLDDKKPEHGRAESLTSSGVGVDSEDDDEKSNISCDSLNSNDPQSNSEDHGYHTPNSEDKTGSPVEYASKATEEEDIIQQVANASKKIRNLRMESAGIYTAKLIEPTDFEEYENVHAFAPKVYKKKPPPPPPPKPADGNKLPVNLLQDIRSRNVRLSATYPSGEKPNETIPQVNASRLVEERTYEERKTGSKKMDKICAMEIDTDKFYKFHLAENVRDSGEKENGNDEETFAGIKDYLCREKPAAITSAKGTIRGVKNRVKAGIATFLQLQENKPYKDKDAGKVVVYTTTMGIVRETYQKCLKVKQILRTLMVKFEERDVFMSSEAQEEIRERMKCNAILVPQVFVEGQHIGDAETIDRLNEMGELRTILKPYKSPDACSTCKVCGGYRLLPCRICKGSKKSVHRNHFTAEFVALKCMNCDQVGLTRCHAC